MVHLHGTQAVAHRRRQRQRVQVNDGRQPRVQVRLRLPAQSELLDDPVERLGGCRSRRSGRRRREHGAGVPRACRQLHRPELGCICRRHLQLGPGDGERRGALGSADGCKPAQRRAGEYYISRPAAGAVVRRNWNDHHLE